MATLRTAMILLAVTLLVSTATAGPNPTLIENLKPGTSTWGPRRAALNREIEGYASRTSVDRGQSIELFVHTTEPSFTYEVFRMGWYGGDGARLMLGPETHAGVAQPMPELDPISGLIECDWRDPIVLDIPRTDDPAEWASGVYLVRLTASASRSDSYITFVVRDDSRPSHFLFQSSVTTYQAYNSWGGKSLYRHSSTGNVAASRVSFNRPYAQGNGAGHFAFSGGWEYAMVRFLEREGFDVTYCTNIDVHDNAPMLFRHRGFLSVGHDEYWSWEMRNNITGARDGGVHVGFFSANTCFWQIRLEPSARGLPNRTMRSHKERALLDDPLALDADFSNDHLITTQWRRAPVNRPEQQLIGVMYVYDPVAADIVVESADHWVFAGTGAQPGTRLPQLLGYEVDAMGPDSPPGTMRLAHSPFPRSDGTVGYSDMTIYQARSGAFVFAVGSIWWSWGLDDFNSGRSRPPVRNEVAEQVTRNVLYRFAGLESPPPRRRRAARH